MTEQQILEQIRPYIAERLNVRQENVTMDADFTNDLGADSLAMVETAMEAEADFRVSISDEEREGLHTVGDLVRLVKSKNEPSAMVLFLMTHGGRKLPNKMSRKLVDKFVMPQKPMMVTPGKKR
jgi:acyl carrier protein